MLLQTILQTSSQISSQALLRVHLLTVTIYRTSCGYPLAGPQACLWIGPKLSLRIACKRSPVLLGACTGVPTRTLVLYQSGGRTMPSVTNPLATRRDEEGRDVGHELRHAFGRQLRKWREARGLTQLDMGKALGIRDTAWSAIELGRNSLSPERYHDAAEALGVPAAEFAQVMLRYYNPWLYGMLWPKGMPQVMLDEIPERTRDLREHVVAKT